jgi:hypothetical protein
MQIITGKDDKGIYRVVDTSDMTIAYVNDFNLKYCRKQGVRFRTDYGMDNWYKLLTLLTKFTLLSKKDDIKLYEDNEYFHKFESLMRKVSNGFSQFETPVQFVSIDITRVHDFFVINVNDIFFYKVAKGLCKLVYRNSENYVFVGVVQIDDGNTFQLSLLELPAHVVHCFNFGNRGNLISWD